MNITQMVVSIKQYVIQSQSTVAVIIGMFVQMFFTKEVSFKILWMIIVSSLFTALYVIPPFLKYLEIDENNDFAISAYALSSVISVEIIALIVNFLPRAIKWHFFKLMDLDQERKKNQ